MATVSTDVTTTPALVLTVGSSLLDEIREVMRIFYQSDPRRKATTQFLVLHADGDHMELCLLCDLTSKNRTQVKSREQVHAVINHHADAILAGVRSTLHELRSHEKLIEVGLGGKSSLPLDVVILADLTEPTSALLETILPMVEGILAHEPYAKIHLLLNIAVFDDDPDGLKNVGAGLQGLQSMLKGGILAGIPQIYLFDRYKEGVWEAGDSLELQTIMGNFLMALLSGGLAQRLAHQVTQPDVEEHHAFFCSASATALIFDMQQLQGACAMRLGAEIIEAEFHSKIDPDPARVNELAADFCVNHANPQTWSGRLCRDTLYHVLPGGQDIELHFSNLHFEDTPMQDWGNDIRRYDARFKDRQFNNQLAAIQKNAGELKNEFLGKMSVFVKNLPQQPRLYPGGVRASQLVIAKIRDDLQSAQSEARDVRELEGGWNKKLAANLEHLEREIQALPKPPTWLYRLPPFLHAPAIQLFNTIFLYRELKSITDMRQSCVRLMEQKYEALAQEEITRQITQLSKGWLNAFEKHAKEVARLQAALDALLRQFKTRTSELISSPSQFRLSVLDESVLAWAYYSGSRPQEGFRRTLLGERGFLADWQKLNRKILGERLEFFCRDIYLPLATVDLEEALHHRNGRDANALALSLQQGAVPLLRPNFDQTGGGASFQLRYFQSRNPLSSSLNPAFKQDGQEWELISTDDRFVAICCRVRMLIPSSALFTVLERGGANAKE